MKLFSFQVSLLLFCIIAASLSVLASPINANATAIVTDEKPIDELSKLYLAVYATDPPNYSLLGGPIDFSDRYSPLLKRCIPARMQDIDEIAGELEAKSGCEPLPPHTEGKPCCGVKRNGKGVGISVCGPGFDDGGCCGGSPILSKNVLACKWDRQADGSVVLQQNNKWIVRHK
ncbi:hypothetical protein EDC01DRAFT_730678 [Geopyxis carbonaria]|nr:hypothetical protein EDC01DRAFT_730678 [Geopyxis carbonaria]